MTFSESTLELPNPNVRLRQAGLTMTIDKGIPLRFFADDVECQSDFVDLMKFGGAPHLLTRLRRRTSHRCATRVSISISAQRCLSSTSSTTVLTSSATRTGTTTVTTLRSLTARLLVRTLRIPNTSPSWGTILPSSLKSD